MEPIPYDKCISSFRIWKFQRNPLSFSTTGFCENSELCEKAFQYYEQLGVEGYDQDENQVLWLIKNDWYTTAQIDRMLKLKAFA